MYHVIRAEGSNRLNDQFITDRSEMIPLRINLLRITDHWPFHYGSIPEFRIITHTDITDYGTHIYISRPKFWLVVAAVKYVLIALLPTIKIILPFCGSMLQQICLDNLLWKTNMTIYYKPPTFAALLPYYEWKGQC